MVFYTKTSAYEVDLQDKRVRRLRGTESPTLRIGFDGVWKNYANISAIMEGLPVLIIWISEHPLHDSSDPKIIPTTLTSAVENVVRDEN